MLKNTNVLISVYLVFVSFSLIANDNPFRGNHIEISSSILKLEQDGRYYNNEMNVLKFGYSRNLNRYLSVGACLGIGTYREWAYWVESDNSWRYSYDHTRGSSITYDLTYKLHILPIIFKKDISFVDLYLNGEVGMIYMNSSTDKVIIPAKGNFFNCSTMGGCALYPSKWFGLFVEYGYEQFVYHHGFHTCYGLSFRF